jgi:hypothetical protein
LRINQSADISPFEVIYNLPMLRVLAFLAVVFWLAPAWGQQPKAAVEDNGNLGISRQQVSWPSPEAVLRDLRSTDNAVRLKAMELMDVGTLSHTKVYSKDGSASESVVSTPDEVELRYAALGEDDTQLAVVMMSLPGSYTFAAVVIPLAHGWTRIATLNGWCKYEQGDLIQKFVSLEPALFQADPTSRYELVAHASGGGTGLYSQQEARFRVYRGQLKRVLYFESRYRSCPPGTEPRFCTLRAKWFNRSVLAESEGRLPENKPDIYFASPEVENEALRLRHCTAYQWDEAAFTYRRLPGEAPECQPNPNR